MEIIRGVTGIAICGRAFELQVGMTFGTGNAVMLAGQFEDGVVVIKVARIPSACCMAVCTLITKRAAMRVCIAVTGGAVFRRADKEFISVALAACNRCMFAVQCEGGAAVVKRGGSPAVGCMTRGALCAKSAGVRIILTVACCAICGRAFEFKVNVAIAA